MLAASSDDHDEDYDHHHRYDQDHRDNQETTKKSPGDPIQDHGPKKPFVLADSRGFGMRSTIKICLPKIVVYIRFFPY